MASFFCFFTMAPYIVVNLGIKESNIAYLFGISGLSFCAGGVFSFILGNTIRAKNLVLVAVCIAIISFWIICVMSLTLGFSAKSFFIPSYLAIFSAGIVYGPGLNIAISHFNELTGTAIALFCAINASLSSIFGVIIMKFEMQSIYPMLCVLGIISLVAIYLLRINR